MLHAYACDQRFDVTGNLENFCELNKALEAVNLAPHFCIYWRIHLSLSADFVSHSAVFFLS